MLLWLSSFANSGSLVAAAEATPGNAARVSVICL